MHRLLVLSFVALASCSLETESSDAVAVAPTPETALAAVPSEAPAAPSRSTPSQAMPLEHFWEASFSGARGDVPRNLDHAAYEKDAQLLTSESLCSRATNRAGERIVALSSYADLRDAGELCWARVVAGADGDWLELAATPNAGVPRVWQRATRKVPDEGILVGLSGRTTVTARYQAPRLTVQGWTTEGELVWTRHLADLPGWPHWTSEGLLVVETQQGAKSWPTWTALDPDTGQLVATQRLEPRLQEIVEDPWALVERSQTSVWGAETWPANGKPDISTAELRVRHSSSQYLAYDVFNRRTGDKIWGKSINAGKHDRTLFVDTEGAWLLVSIVTGDIAGPNWERNSDAWRVMNEAASGIEVSAYELATGTPIGRWSYEFTSNYRQP